LDLYWPLPGASRRGAARPGLCPGPHQRALPSGLPPRAEPLEPAHLVVGREGRPRRKPPRRRLPMRRLAARSPLPPHNQMDGVQRLRLWWGSRGQSPWRVSGQRPDFASLTRFPRRANGSDIDMGSERARFAYSCRVSTGSPFSGAGYLETSIRPACGGLHRARHPRGVKRPAGNAPGRPSRRLAAAPSSCPCIRLAPELSRPLH
jgi:hypothetical protein